MAHEIFMPSAADFNMLILGVSYSLYDGAWLPVRATYNRFRPRRWPAAETLLSNLGYTTDAAGWREFLKNMVDGEVIDRNTSRMIAIDHGRLPPSRPGPKWGDELSLTLDYAWPWNGPRERRDAVERGWV